MRAKELVPILADRWGVGQDLAIQLDRAMFEADLRAKNKGRALPDLTRAEAIRFLIVCMVSEKKTKLSSETLNWVGAKGFRPAIPTETPGLLDGEFDEIFVEKLCLQRMIDHLIEPFVEPDGGAEYVSLVDYLLALTHLLQHKRLPPDVAQISFSTTYSGASVSFLRERGGLICRQHFWPAHARYKDSVGAGPQRIERVASVYGVALAVIAAHTADPLA